MPIRRSHIDGVITDRAYPENWLTARELQVTAEATTRACSQERCGLQDGLPDPGLPGCATSGTLEIGVGNGA